MFEVKDKVVYPGHGVAIIDEIIEKQIAGTNVNFFKLTFLYKDMTILLPVHNIQSSGVRYPGKGDEVTNAFGETTEIKTEYIHVAVGIDENQLGNIISVYPNPNSGLFNIETGGLEIEYEIYSIIGELVLKNKTNNPVEIINLTDHGKGLYFIRIREINGTIILTKKVVIK